MVGALVFPLRFTLYVLAFTFYALRFMPRGILLLLARGCQHVSTVSLELAVVGHPPAFRALTQREEHLLGELFGPLN